MNVCGIKFENTKTATMVFGGETKLKLSHRNEALFATGLAASSASPVLCLSPPDKTSTWTQIPQFRTHSP
jgi:hypothetical protein